MAIWNLLGKPTPRVTDLTHLLEPGWTGGRITVLQSVGGAVTIHANSLTRAEAGEGTTSLLTLPSHLRPVESVYGNATHRGYRVRCLIGGVLSIDNPGTAVDYLSVTYVPRGGA